MVFMVNNTWSNENISLKNLYLWDENARFPDKYFNKSEKELIAYFCLKENFKILELAQETIKDFDLPQIEKVVVWRINEKNIVLEGNRRLVVYKLLNNPNLIDDAKLKEKFLDLKSKINIDENFEVECLVTPEIEEGYRYIERKHLNKNYEISWGDNERAHHRHRIGKAKKQEQLKVGITNIINELKISNNIKDSILGPGYVTTFWRIINSSSAWEKYDFKINEEGKLTVGDKQFNKKLKVIIANILKKEDFQGEKIDSRSLNKKERIKKYLESITPEDYKKAEEEINKQEKEDSKDKDNFEKKANKVNPKSTSRKYLIPKSCCITIDINKVPKINNIFRELRDDLLINDSKKAVPNAVGVLFRVFLEVSLDYYAKKNQHGFKKEDTISKKIPWIVNDLISKGYKKSKFSYINKVGSAKKENTYLSIDNFHEYVHSTTTQPTPSELKLKWDNLQEFFEILWEEIAKKERKKKK